MPSSATPTTRTNRFQSFTPLRSNDSLHRLKTAFSPVRQQSPSSMRSANPSSSSSVTPLTLTRDCSPHSQRPHSSASSIRHFLTTHPRPNPLESEMEEEKQLFEAELHILEPRPNLGFSGCRSDVHVVGIFEVLDGKF